MGQNITFGYRIGTMPVLERVWPVAAPLVGGLTIEVRVIWRGLACLQKTGCWRQQVVRYEIRVVDSTDNIVIAIPIVEALLREGSINGHMCLGSCEHIRYPPDIADCTVPGSWHPYIT